MAQINKLSAAGDSLTDAAGTSGILHWYHLGIAQYPSIFGSTDGAGRPFNVARAGHSAQVVNGQNGATATSHWRISAGFFGNGWIDQIYHQLAPTLKVGIGGNLEAGTSNTAVIWIGQNDFTPVQSNAYEWLYDGTWDESDSLDYATDIHDSIIDGVDDYLTYGNGQVLVCTVVPYNLSPTVRAAFPIAANREHVEDCVHRLNQMILASCQERRVPVLDMHALYNDVLGSHDNPTATMSFGGNTIDLQNGNDTNPNFYGFQYEGGDMVHPTTTISSILLVAILNALHVAGWLDDWTKPSESTMCSWCTGLATGGADTRNLRYESYVRAFNLDTTGLVDASGVFTPGVAAGGVFIPGVVAGQAV